MTSIVKPTELCGHVNEEEQKRCGRPKGHGGLHMTTDHKHQWAQDRLAGGPSSSPSTPPVQAGPVCGARHPTGKTCGYAIGHGGPHASADHSICWGNSTRVF